MHLLLDTQIYLWAAQGNKRLTPKARLMIQSADVVYVSAASIWEIAIKAALGRIEADPVALAENIELRGYRELPIGAHDGALVQELPLHHADPFDRILLVQAMSRGWKLMTADSILPQYGDTVIKI